MSKRLATIAATLGAALLLFAVLSIASASAAPSPWWQVVTGSRPTNLWKATDNVQEIETELGQLETSPSVVVTGAAARIDLGGSPIGCLATVSTTSTTLCRFIYCPTAAFCNGSRAVTNTAAQLKALLEARLKTPVEVTGGPVGAAPFVVKVPGRNVPAITFFQQTGVPDLSTYGTFRSKVLSPGGSGRLILGITNLGDAAVDATETSVSIEDQLPDGMIATDVAGFAGAGNDQINCVLDSPTHVKCTYEGTLPSYESVEVEVFVSLAGEPPFPGTPGEVTVSGGNAPSVQTDQEVKISPEPTPFGIERFSSGLEEEEGGPASQAGAHPFQLTTMVQMNSGPATGVGGNLDVEEPAQVRNLHFPLPAGLIGNVGAAPRCSMTDFFAPRSEIANQCPDATAVGVVNISFIQPDVLGHTRAAQPVFNLEPGYGEPARFGFTVAGNPIVINTAVDPNNQYRVIASANNTTQVVDLLSSTLVLWGTPGDPRHDTARGWGCSFNVTDVGPCERPAGLAENAFLRLPVSCVTPLDFRVDAEPWNVPLGSPFDTAPFDGGTLHGCNIVPFNPAIDAAPTNRSAGGPSGLDFRLDMPNAGLLNKDAIAEGQAKKVEVTLPEGVTVNPSAANGLGACTPAEYARERFDSAPGQGCPESSKIGSVDITTPLLDEEAHGSVYVAAPHDNPFDSLLALYLVAKIPDRGILVKQAGKVSLDPATGQIVTTFDDLPQIPFDTFDLHFKEGDRAPLVMPSACGKYDIVTRFTPWHASNPDNPLPSEIVTRSSTFTVDRGPNGGPCPSGTPPFKPGFTAGTVNNAAGSYSPFDARLTREDGEQEFTRFSMRLPKGVIGKLAGIPFCPDAAISAARARTGSSGGQEELEHPSCPGASEIGHTLVGAGVGSTLTYAPGELYLAGPFRGSKLSVVAITTAKVGPFDLGTVVIRQALRVDPDTAQVAADGSSSEPIPHILQGVVVHVRDIRIDVDRHDFILNPTSCDRMRVGASVAGSGQPVEVSVPFQAADCASLGFRPRLSLSLRGGTRRGDNPRLKAVVRARKGDANIGAAVVTLPHSAFLDQAHIRTVCTRVQFNAGDGNGEKCPKGSIYGRVRAVSPLLDEQLRGPVYLRSSSHPLPDLVAALHSRKVDINLDGRIDSVGNGRIRNIFQAVPDAPVTRFTLEMQGGRKGLLVNSTNICRGKHRAAAVFTGQNGKRRLVKPLVRAKCGGKKH